MSEFQAQEGKLVHLASMSSNCYWNTVDWQQVNRVAKTAKQIWSKFLLSRQEKHLDFHLHTRDKAMQRRDLAGLRWCNTRTVFAKAYAQSQNQSTQRTKPDCQWSGFTPTRKVWTQYEQCFHMTWSLRTLAQSGTVEWNVCSLTCLLFRSRFFLLSLGKVNKNSFHRAASYAAGFALNQLQLLKDIYLHRK